MKKTFMMLLMFAAISVNVLAQSAEYKQKTKDLIELGTSSYSPKQMKQSMKEMMTAMLSQMGQQLGKKEEISTVTEAMGGVIDEAFGDYFENGEFVADMVEVLAPHYSKEFTLDELNQIEAIYKSEKGQRFLNKSQSCMSNMSGAIQKLVGPIMTIAMGGEAPAIEKVNCPADYRELFMTYFELTAGSSVEQIKSRFGSDDSNPLVKKIQTYTVEALPEMVLDITYPNLTKSDLQDGIDITSTPLIQRYIKSSTTIDEAAMTPITTKIQQRVSNAVSKLPQQFK